MVTEQNCLRTTLRVFNIHLTYSLLPVLVFINCCNHRCWFGSSIWGTRMDLVLARKKPKFPELPTSGLYRIIRHPIYASFFLAVLTVPTWTADQIVVSLILGGYCIFAPILKDRRLIERHGEKYLRYKKLPHICFPAK